jgi:hypothetical protein
MNPHKLGRATRSSLGERTGQAPLNDRAQANG